MDWETQLWVVGASAYAMVLGGVVGYERELKNRPAGFRTHMLVAGASALLVGIGRMAVFDPAMPQDSISIDPLRIVEAVVAGVAFIGAGTIFGRRGAGDRVEGITTAATLLMVAVIGISAGFRYFWMATAATAVTMTVLTLLNVVEKFLGRNKRNGFARTSSDASGSERPAKDRPNRDG